MTVGAWLRLPLSLLRIALCWPVRQCCRGPLERWRPGWNWTFCGECFWGGPLGWAVPERSLFLCPVCKEEV